MSSNQQVKVTVCNSNDSTNEVALMSIDLDYFSDSNVWSSCAF